MKNSFDFVLDCSVTMTWCFEDECNNEADAVLEKLNTSKAIVPGIWSLEVANVLLIAQRAGRIQPVQVAEFIDALLTLPITIDPLTSSRAMHSTMTLAQEHDLTIYDATYLELALREKIPLITLDKQLKKAAKKLHIPLSLN